MSVKRVCAVYFTILLCLSFLAVRLYLLSTGNKSRTVLSGQYTRKLDIAQRSGFIYDSKGELLSHKISHISVTINPSLITKNVSSAAETIANLCSVPLSEIYSYLYEGKVFSLTAPANADLSVVEGIDGIYCYYLYEENYSDAVHLVGYKNSDGTAMSGVLLDYKSSLSALSGRVFARFEANALSRSMDSSLFEIYEDAYTKTDGLVLTIDSKLQRFTDSLGQNIIDMGSVIITDINTGDILALSSYPSYNPENIARSLSSERGELINRATALFTPGSVFKIVVAAAALEQDQNLSDFVCECTGSIEVENNVFRCHNTSGHGKQDLSDAFANSCNTYFIELGQKIGIEAIISTANKLGVGNAVFADTLRASAAKLPNPANCPANLLANISFGQGSLLLSPLDLVNVTNAAGTSYLPTLSVIKGVYKNGVLHETQKSPPIRVLSDSTSEKLRSMMKKCVQEGTGKKAYLDGVSSGGKTATAQTGQKDKNGKEILHTWFCGIYPENMPKYSIIILCDGNGRNNYSPAEIFGIVNKYLVNCGY